MKNEKSERKFDFRPMGLAIKKAREKKGMTQEQLADIIGRDTRTVMYHENDGQHPSLDIFYIKTCEAIVLIDCHNLPSLLFAVFFQHITLVCDTGTFALQVIVL